MVTDYMARAKTLASGLCSGDEAMRAVTLDMVNDSIPEVEAERLIIGILWDVFECDSFMEYLNSYRELRLRAVGGSTETPEPECPRSPIGDVVQSITGKRGKHGTV